MHPADQFEAFVTIIDQGKSIIDVAARFNVCVGLSDNTCLELRAMSARSAIDCKATKAFEDKRESWGERIPGDPDQLYSWCLDQHTDMLIDLLAFLAASLPAPRRAQ